MSSSIPVASSTAFPAASSQAAMAPLAGASLAPRSAPADGAGQALLRTVRVGRNPGYERIVFEFASGPHPGYRVRWIPGPITGDASDATIPVAGSAHLQIIMEPASGVDMNTGAVIYRGPDRIPVAGQTVLVTDLVRTGDFEDVLSWVAGAGRRVPFRVLSLSSPTRLVVDLQAP